MHDEHRTDERTANGGLECSARTVQQPQCYLPQDCYGAINLYHRRSYALQCLSVRRVLLALTPCDLYGGEIYMTSIQLSRTSQQLLYQLVVTNQLAASSQGLSVRRAFLALTPCDLYGGEICRTVIQHPTPFARKQSVGLKADWSPNQLSSTIYITVPLEWTQGYAL